MKCFFIDKKDLKLMMILECLPRKYISMGRKNRFRMMISITSTIVFIILFILTNNYPPHTKVTTSYTMMKN